MVADQHVSLLNKKDSEWAKQKMSDHQARDHMIYRSNQDPLESKRGLYLIVPLGQNA